MAIFELRFLTMCSVLYTEIYVSSIFLPVLYTYKQKNILLWLVLSIFGLDISRRKLVWSTFFCQSFLSERGTNVVNDKIRNRFSGTERFYRSEGSLSCSAGVLAFMKMAGNENVLLVKKNDI